jgi:hypothetical protein
MDDYDWVATWPPCPARYFSTKALYPFRLTVAAIGKPSGREPTHANPPPGDTTAKGAPGLPRKRTAPCSVSPAPAASQPRSRSCKTRREPMRESAICSS